MFGLFKKKSELAGTDLDTADQADLERATFIQQKAQVGEMFAKRLADPQEDHGDALRRYEGVRNELLGILDEIEDEFSRGFGAHSIIRMAMAANEVPLCRALLIGVRDQFLREKILEDAPELKGKR
jgi:hypothetical protein